MVLVILRTVRLLSLRSWVRFSTKKYNFIVSGCTCSVLDCNLSIIYIGIICYFYGIAGERAGVPSVGKRLTPPDLTDNFV